MDNLISLDALMQFPIRLNHYDKENGSEEYVFGVEAVLEYAQNLPFIDANISVVHGQWYKPIGVMMPPEHHGRHRCSVCNFMALYERPGREELSDYCPNCGAKMDQLQIIHGDCGALTAEEAWKRLYPNLSIMDKEE